MESRMVRDRHLDLQAILRKSQLVGVLEQMCQQIELTNTQFCAAEDRYNAVAKWLGGAVDSPVNLADIYPQGSISHQTTVKPIGKNEYDVDLVCFLPTLVANSSPTDVKRLIGDRLRANGTYRKILEEKSRCWRLNYANEFHLDITPSIPNHGCTQGGEFVPDREARRWKASNPRGYRDWFQKKAELTPILRVNELLRKEQRAQIEALPKPSTLKGILRRCVQLCKRHRDIWGSKGDPSLAPISIIITTLAARSYEYCCRQANMYDTDLDMVLEIVRLLPTFVEAKQVNGRTIYAVWNDTTAGENFAEKWNENPGLASAFYRWQQAAANELEGLMVSEGTHTVRRSLAESFGSEVVERTYDAMAVPVETARRSGALRVLPGVGLSTSGSSGTPVASNSFYGR